MLPQTFVAKDTTGLWLQARVAYLRNRNNDEAAGKYARLSLLLDSDLPEAHKLAAKLHAASPSNLSFTCTYALSLLKKNRTQEALPPLRQVSAAQSKDPFVALYKGIVLAAAGESEAAKTLLDQAETAPLLPEEQALVGLARRSQGDLLQALVPAPRPK
jgi:predicted Zn-dependent protease